MTEAQKAIWAIVVRNIKARQEADNGNANQ